jgi:hypothetical protein
MGNQLHRIFRQYWRVSAGSEAEAFMLRKQIHERLEDTFVPIFETVFNEHLLGDEILYIPRLEIKLKVSGDFELCETIGDKLYEQLSEMLGPKKSESGRSEFYNPLTSKPEPKNLESDNLDFYNQASSVSGSERPKPDELPSGESAMIRITPKQYRFEVLLHYLQHGDLPWQEKTRTNEASSEFLMAIMENRQKLMDFLHNYSVSYVFLFRLFQFLSIDEINLLSKDLCNHLSFAAKEELNNLIVALLQSEANDFNQYTRKILLAACVEAGISHHQSNKVPDWFEKVASLVPPEKLDELRQYCNLVPDNPLLIASVRTRNQDKLNPSEISEKTGPALENNGPTVGNKIRRNLTNVDFVGLSTLEGLLPKAGQFMEYPGFQSNISTEDPVKDFLKSFPFNQLQDGVNRMAQNVGLLLLHPFITSFFNHTGILAVGEREIQGCNLSKAAALLHYLATGRDEVFEFEIGFIKILLGLDPDQPLPVSGGIISREQKEETESLLKSVLGHWSALKNTSVNVLRTSFIQRVAMIHETENGWEVRPESSSYDVLLNTIPWGFSIIRLPWMNKSIYTEWQTN